MIVNAESQRLTAALRRTGRVELGIRTVILLDGASAAAPSKLDALIAASPGSRKFLSTVLGRLSRCGITASNRGPLGGYWLARPLEQITVLDIVEALGPGPDFPLGGARGSSDEQSDPIEGRLEALWSDVDDRLREVLAAATIRNLVGTV